MKATIAVGASLSNGVNLGGQRVAAIVVPPNTEGSALTFQGSADGVNWYNLYADESGTTEVSVAITVGAVNVLPRDIFAGIPHLKVRTGTAASPTAQTGADAVLTLLSSS